MPVPPFLRLTSARARPGVAPRRAGVRGLAALLALAVVWASWVGWVHAVLHAPHGAAHAGGLAHRHDVRPGGLAHGAWHGADADCEHDHGHAFGPAPLHVHAPVPLGASDIDHGDGPAGAAPPSTGALAALFSHEDGGLACQLFDQLTHHDGLVPTAAVLAAEPVSPPPSAVHPDGRTVRPAGFRLARGPPSTPAAPRG